jgi:hypothetical protein
LNDFSITGGARIGWVNASWPFAKLSSNKEKLIISSLGEYTFEPEQVVSLEKYGFIPFLASGISIKHNRNDYPETVIFWCLGNRENTLAKIKLSGFYPRGEIKARAKGLPIRWSVIIAFVVIWNAIFFLGGAFNLNSSPTIKPILILPLILAFAFSCTILKSEQVQSFVLNEGHQIKEIESLLILLQIVSGFLSVLFSIFVFFQIPSH